jgi:hypothetical protein
VSGYFNDRRVVDLATKAVSLAAQWIDGFSATGASSTCRAMRAAFNARATRGRDRAVEEVVDSAHQDYGVRAQRKPRS